MRYVCCSKGDLKLRKVDKSQLAEEILKISYCKINIRGMIFHSYSKRFSKLTFYRKFKFFTFQFLKPFAKPVLQIGIKSFEGPFIVQNHKIFRAEKAKKIEISQNQNSACHHYVPERLPSAYALPTHFCLSCTNACTAPGFVPPLTLGLSYYTCTGCPLYYTLCV